MDPSKIDHLNAIFHSIAEQGIPDAKKRGWDIESRSHLEILGSAMVELAEAINESKYGLTYTKDDKPEGVLAEVADCLIILACYCDYHEFDIASAIVDKMEYNHSRTDNLEL